MSEINMIKKIRILGLDYKVQLYHSELSGITDAGQVLNTQAIIMLNETCNNPEHLKSVLLHEIIEALHYRLELKLEHNQITSLETGLFQVLSDNKKFVKLFLNEGQE